YAMLALGLLIGAGSCILTMVNAARRPFCRGCEGWKDEVRLGAVFMVAQEAEAILANGALAELARHPLATRRLIGKGGRGAWRFDKPVDVDAGPLELTAHYCPDCASAEPVEVQLQQVTAVKKSKLLRHVLGVWTYPAAAWWVLDHLFPGQLEEDERG